MSEMVLNREYINAETTRANAPVVVNIDLSHHTAYNISYADLNIWKYIQELIIYSSRKKCLFGSLCENSPYRFARLCRRLLLSL